MSLDPDFALAHAWLGESYVYAALYQHAPARALMPKARAEASKALELGAIEANGVLALVAMWFDWDWTEARERFQRVREARPRTLYAGGAQAGQGQLLCTKGNWESGLEEMREAATVDPLYFFLREWVHDGEARARRYDAAIEGCNALLAIDPHRVHPYNVLWWVHWWKGEFDDAVAAYEGSLEQLGVDAGGLSEVYRKSGFRAYLRALIAFWEKRWERAGAGSMLVAWYYGYLGEADLAFEWLERAYQERDPNLAYAFNLTPAFDPVRNDPRFAELAERLGIPIVDPDGPLVAPLPD